MNNFTKIITVLIYILTCPSVFAQQLGKSESLIVNMLDEDKAFHSVDQDVFENLGVGRARSRPSRQSNR